MGFIMRLNSRDLVNDPKNGAEVYPITATNAVYRAGTDKNLEQILSELSNSADRKVIQDISYISNTNKLHKEFTDNTTEDITLPNFVKDVKIKNTNTESSIVTDGIAKIPDYPVTLEIVQSGLFDGESEGMTHRVKGTTALGNHVFYDGHIFPPRLVEQGNGNAITRIGYSRDEDTTKLNRLNLNVYKGNFITDVQIRGASVINNNIANMDVVKNNNDIRAVQYVASETAYQSMTKDPNTLYFIPVENN